jgi:molecular chaperone HscB
MNYFELFGLPVQVNVDTAVLSRKYFSLQKQFHPDFFTQEDSLSQEEALEKSSEINRAFKTLKDPDATLFYILQLKGTATPDEKYQLPPDFLMEVMELNENLSESTGEDIRAFEEKLYGEVKPLLESYDNSRVTQAELERLKTYYYKKKYLHRILERMDG